MKQQIKAFLETILLAVVSIAGCKIYDMIAGTSTTIERYTLCLLLIAIYFNEMKRNEDEDED